MPWIVQKHTVHFLEGSLFILDFSFLEMSSTLVFGCCLKESTWLKDLKNTSFQPELQNTLPTLVPSGKNFRKRGCCSCVPCKLCHGHLPICPTCCRLHDDPMVNLCVHLLYIIMSIMRLAYYAATSAKISAEEDPDVLLGDVNVKESVKDLSFLGRKGVGQGYVNSTTQLLSPDKNLATLVTLVSKPISLQPQPTPSLSATLPRTRLPTRPPGATRQHCLLSQNVPDLPATVTDKLREVRKKTTRASTTKPISI